MSLEPLILQFALVSFTSVPLSGGGILEPRVDAGALAFRPILLLDAGLVKTARPVQGEPGFALRRARIGGRVHWERWFELVFQAQLERDRVGVLDGFVVARPFSDLELSVGYRRVPMFATGRDIPVAELPLLERSNVVRAFWPERDVGAEARLVPRTLPIEIIGRIGNGNRSPLANADDGYAAEIRADLVLGRAWREARALFGLRLGGTYHWEETRDAPGVGGETSAGFPFWRPPPVSGQRHIVAPHAIMYLGPLTLVLEGAYAREGRAVDDDGDPATPRVARAGTESWGGSAELWWAVIGPHRSMTGALFGPGDGVLRGGGGRLDVGARFERLVLGRRAGDVLDGGAWVGAAGGRYWFEPQLGMGATLEVYRFDERPIEDPTGVDAFVGWVRLIARLGTDL